MSSSLPVDGLVLLAAGLLLAAVLASALAQRLGSAVRIPAALLFLGVGMLAGNDGLDLVDLSDAGFVRDLGVLALLLILFEGGLTTKPTDVRLAAVPGGLLATLGVVLTAAVTGLGVWLLTDLDLLTSALLGAIVGSTDAAAVFSTMRTTPLPRRLSAVLRFESGANDPVAVLLTVGLLAVIETGGTRPLDWVVFLTLQLGLGALAGAAVGLGGAWLLRRVELGLEGLYPVVAAALAGLAYGLAAAAGGSGFLAVYLAGLAVGGLVPRHRRSIRGFHEAMANAAEIGLFLLLGLLVSPSALPGIALPALAVTAVLVLIARPIAVLACTTGSGLGWRGQLIVVVAGLKGAVPIVLATFPATAGTADGRRLFDLVFFVVLVSVLVQGTALLPLVRRLGLEDDRPAWAPVAEALPLDGIEVDLVELHISADLAIAGRRLRDLPELGEARVAVVIRDGRVVIPHGSTRLRAGDVALLTAPTDGRLLDRLTAWARGEVSDPGLTGRLRGLPLRDPPGDDR